MFAPQALTIHIVSPEKSLNYKWEQYSERLSKSLDIMSIDELDKLPVDIKSRYFAVPSFEEGMVLVLDRISKRYYPITQAQDELPASKNRAIDHIAALLGAKSISRTIINRAVFKREFNTSGEISISKVSADASYSTQQKDSQEKKFIYNKKFNGNRTIEGYRQAEEFCKDTGLIYDPEIQQMLADRNPNHPNALLEEEYNISLTSDYEQISKAAFSIKYMGDVFALSGDVNQSLETVSELVIKCKIEYGD